MVSYRRARVPGGTYFFTLALHDRRSMLLVEHVDVLRHAFRLVLGSRPFTLPAIVILPDHLHAIWTLPPDDFDFPGRWKAIKSAFTRGVKSKGVRLHANPKNEHALWQRRYWEHLIVNETDFSRHVDYIHANPVKHRLVRAARDWPWSSFHHHVQQGLLPIDWMGMDDSGACVGHAD